MLEVGWVDKTIWILLTAADNFWHNTNTYKLKWLISIFAGINIIIICIPCILLISGIRFMVMFLFFSLFTCHILSTLPWSSIQQGRASSSHYLVSLCIRVLCRWCSSLNIIDQICIQTKNFLNRSCLDLDLMGWVFIRSTQ